MDALGINLGQLVSQVVNLLILLVALRSFLYRPVLNMLDQRSERIRQSLEDAETAAQKAAQAEADYQQRIGEAQRTAQAMLDQANQEARSLRERTLHEARDEAQRYLDRARREIGLERQQALRAQKAQLADLVIAAASKLVAHQLDETAHRQLVEQFLADPGD